ncbi:hypothetical protein COD46_00730 [Escherichia coli]|nr:hypothetical protein [Escherichia coli]PBQ51244.1 hypothetical protein COD52_19505 [Escherichia coli]PBQ58165.1 hypothetical protein COD51_08870 [Escherichia coli]PBQ95947.1 hypothetical protein COD37_00815 [Escherichia coli]PBR54191.1 hypothetical protein COD46_00730 [Escherichia coli]
MTCIHCKKWGIKVGIAGNLTKLKRYSPLSGLYTSKKVGSKKYNEKQSIRLTQKTRWEASGKFKKWGTKAGSSGE